MNKNYRKLREEVPREEIITPDVLLSICGFQETTSRGMGLGPAFLDMSLDPHKTLIVKIPYHIDRVTGEREYIYSPPEDQLFFGGYIDGIPLAVPANLKVNLRSGITQRHVKTCVRGVTFRGYTRSAYGDDAIAVPFSIFYGIPPKLTDESEFELAIKSCLERLEGFNSFKLAIGGQQYESGNIEKHRKIIHDELDRAMRGVFWYREFERNLIDLVVSP